MADKSGSPPVYHTTNENYDEDGDSPSPPPPGPSSPRQHRQQERSSPRQSSPRQSPLRQQNGWQTRTHYGSTDDMNSSPRQANKKNNRNKKKNKMVGYDESPQRHSRGRSLIHVSKHGGTRTESPSASYSRGPEMSLGGAGAGAAGNDNIFGSPSGSGNIDIIQASLDSEMNHAHSLRHYQSLHASLRDSLHDQSMTPLQDSMSNEYIDRNRIFRNLACGVDIRLSPYVAQINELFYDTLGLGADRKQVIHTRTPTMDAMDKENDKRKTRYHQISSVDEVDGFDADEIDADYRKKRHVHKGNCSLLETSFNALNYMIGACILSMPYALRMSGWVAILSMVLTCTLTGLTAFLIDEILERYPMARSYPDMIQIILGKKVENSVAIIMCFELYLYVVLFFIFGGETISSLADDEVINVFDLFSFKLSTQNGIILTTIVTLPTVYLTNMKPLAYLSTFGIVAMVTIIVAVYRDSLMQSGVFDNDHERNTEQTLFTDLNKVGYCSGIVIACFSAHAVLPNLKTSMKKPQQFKIVIAITYVSITIIMVSVGIAGYWAYGEITEELIQSNFEKSDWTSTIAKSMLLVKVWATVALTMYPVTMTIEAAIMAFSGGYDMSNVGGSGHGGHGGGDDSGKSKNKNQNQNKTKNKNGDGKSVKNRKNIKNEKNRENSKQELKKKLEFWKIFVVRTILTVGACIIAYVLPSFEFVANLIGSICALGMTIVFPTWCYVVDTLKRRKKNKIDSMGVSAMLKVTLCVITVILGLAIGVWNLCELVYFGPSGPS